LEKELLSAAIMNKMIKFKPTSSGIRHQINIKKNLLSKTNKFVKNSIFGLKSSSGRSSNTGRITVRHMGGGCKKKFRIINFSNTDKNSLVVSIMYDPFRSSFTTLNFDILRNNFFRSITTNNVNPGSLVKCKAEGVELKLGNRTKLENVPTGSIMHSLSLNSSAKYVRSAGSFFQLIQKGLSICQVRLPSGAIKEAAVSSFGTLGTISNFQHNLVVTGKAGRNRLLGVRPTVRGIAMNPVDHPHGGNANGGKRPVTPWGIPTRGKPTVNKGKSAKS
jgi:large subunit ribosomal protein L2